MSEEPKDSIAPTMLEVLAGRVVDGVYEDGCVRVTVKDGKVEDMEGLPLKDVFIYEK